MSANANAQIGCPLWGQNVLQNSSLRRESAIIESEPVGHSVLLVVVAPLPAFLAVEAGARPDHPIIGS
jgi:hypothetical protein